MPGPYTRRAEKFVANLMRRPTPANVQAEKQAKAKELETVYQRLGQRRRAILDSIKRF